MDQAFDARLQFNERTVIGNVRNPASKARTDWVFRFDALPRVGFKLFHAEADTLGFRIETDNLNVQGLAYLNSFGRVVNAPPRNIRDVQKTIHTAEIHESTVIRNVFDHTFQDLAFL